MQHHTTTTSSRTWYQSAHASLCLLGMYLRQRGFFDPLEAHVKIEQKVLKYTPVQKLEMFFVGLLAGAKAVSYTATTVRVDPALVKALRTARMCRAVHHCRDPQCGHRTGCGRPARGRGRTVSLLQSSSPS
jgi:hypothetical protein